MNDFDYSERTRQLFNGEINTPDFNVDTIPISDYESPIELITRQVSEQVEQTHEKVVMTQLMNIGVNVNKNELIKALQYDRGQYEKGYKNGYKDGYSKGIEDCLAKIGEIVKGGDDNA